MCSPLIDAAERFRTRLESARTAIGPMYFAWYPYDSLGNSVHLTRMFEGTGFDLASLIGGKRILDLGCADGDFAFFLESLGASVVAVDHPRGNHNNLKGIARLIEQLKSSVELRVMDLDAGVNTGGERFEFALALGLLYHLKNPFQFLESLAKCTRYAVISTRVMRQFPGSQTDMAATPVAYLLSADELNADSSNFWIFTEAGLRRLLDRAHWRVRAWTSAGEAADSNPHSLDKDERAFCFLESKYGHVGVIPGPGWHEPEDSGWRWTEKHFTASAHGAQDADYITMSIYVPDALVAEFGAVSLDVRVNGTPAGPETFSTPGLVTYTRRLPVRGGRLDLDFRVSHALPPDKDDPRERSLIIESVELESA